MSRELEASVLLKEYITDLNLNKNNITQKDIKMLADELKYAGEFGLAHLVLNLNNPKELWDYIGEEE